MKGYLSLGFTILVVFLSIDEGSADTCEQENLFGITTYYNCPQPGEPEKNRFCCGTKRNRYCCDTFLGLDDEVLKQFTDKLPVILGVIGAVILGLIVLCIVCCCCCPFCLLHKRRNRGAVHNPNTADVTVTQPLQPVQPMQPYPGQQPYPAQGGYPPQQQPYPPQPYPPQGYPAQPGYPPQPYPPQANPPAVYPVDQPPPYSEKQLPYNPNYQQ